MTKVTITDIKLAEKKVITASYWYFAKGLLLGAIIMYAINN